jgi:hypothetical protein
VALLITVCVCIIVRRRRRRRASDDVPLQLTADMRVATPIGCADATRCSALLLTSCLTLAVSAHHSISMNRRANRWAIARACVRACVRVAHTRYRHSTGEYAAVRDASNKKQYDSVRLGNSDIDAHRLSLCTHMYDVCLTRVCIDRQCAFGACERAQQLLACADATGRALRGCAHQRRLCLERSMYARASVCACVGVRMTPASCADAPANVREANNYNAAVRAPDYASIVATPTAGRVARYVRSRQITTR